MRRASAWNSHSRRQLSAKRVSTDSTVSDRRICRVLQRKARTLEWCTDPGTQRTRQQLPSARVVCDLVDTLVRIKRVLGSEKAHVHEPPQ